MRWALALLLIGCGPPSVIPARTASPQLLETRVVDGAPQEPARLVAPEALLRSYVRLFGVQSPLDATNRARGKDGRALFDGWDVYLSPLGLPDYKNDLPRAVGTNALMLATFERIAEALCDRAVERELRARPPMNQRAVFTFDLPPQKLDAAAFASRFDALHRTFLGYPAQLAPHRTDAFFALYAKVTARHGAGERLAPSEAGMAAVCVALARHPELHLY